MPEWFTPLLRVLVAMPSFGNCSTRKTSCQRFDMALAMAQPITPPPMIRMLAWSMNSEYRKWKKENRKIVCLEVLRASADHPLGDEHIGNPAQPGDRDVGARERPVQDEQHERH